MNEEIIIYHHLGLGDSIECNAIVRNYAKQYKNVYIFSKTRNLESVEFMYRDLHNINIVPIITENERYEFELFMRKNHKNLLLVGHEKYFPFVKQYESRGFSCTEAFYEIANIDYRKKYDDFYFLRDNKEEERVYNKLNPKNEKYIFVHDDSNRGFNLNIKTNYKIIKNDPTENIFYMLKVLEKAEEIHCMSSSFLCLIDCMTSKIDFKSLNLYYNIRNVFFGPNTLSKKWKIIL